MPKKQYRGKGQIKKYEVGFQTPQKRTKPRNYSPAKKSQKNYKLQGMDDIKINLFSYLA